jgi:predicted RNA-binding protein with RPS1 domain
MNDEQNVTSAAAAEETVAAMVEETSATAVMDVAAEPTPEDAPATDPVMEVAAEAAETVADEATEVIEETVEVVVDEADTVEIAAVAQEAPKPIAAAVSPNAASPKSIGDLTVGIELNGKVKRIELYGAFVDLGIGTDGLLHISQLGRRDVRNVEDVVQVGQDLAVYVLKVDADQRRIALSLVKPSAPLGLPWEAMRQGMDVTGTVVKIETYGVFLDIGAERPGMIHVSELANDYVKSPADVVAMGEAVTARIIKLDRRKKRIDLSVKALQAQENRRAMAEVAEPDEQLPTAMELAMRQAMGQNSGYSKKARDAEKRDRRDRQDREMEDIISRTLKSHGK